MAMMQERGGVVEQEEEADMGAGGPLLIQTLEVRLPSHVAVYLPIFPFIFLLYSFLFSPSLFLIISSFSFFFLFGIFSYLLWTALKNGKF